MIFVINGKTVDFSKALPYVKPWKEWTMGEKRVLDRLGFDLTARDSTVLRATYDDLIALVVYFGMKANRSLTPSDVNSLTDDALFGKMALCITEHFIPRIFVADENPLGTAPGGSASGESPTPSPSPSDGVPATSTN